MLFYWKLYSPKTEPHSFYLPSTGGSHFGKKSFQEFLPDGLSRILKVLFEHLQLNASGIPPEFPLEFSLAGSLDNPLRVPLGKLLCFFFQKIIHRLFQKLLRFFFLIHHQTWFYRFLPKIKCSEFLQKFLDGFLKKP